MNVRLLIDSGPNYFLLQPPFRVQFESKIEGNCIYHENYLNDSLIIRFSSDIQIRITGN